MHQYNVLILVVYMQHEIIEEMGPCMVTSLLRKNGFNVMLVGEKYNKFNYDELKEFSPDIVLINMYIMTKELVYDIITRLKEVIPSVKIGVGGYHPTYYGKIIMEEFPLIDYVIKGQGEYISLELINRLQQKQNLDDLHGIIYRTSNGIQENEGLGILTENNLNELPFAARDILVKNKLNYAMLSTSRGCIGQCTFCYSHMGCGWIPRDINNILDEIDILYYDYGIKYFTIVDPCFEGPKEYYNRLWEFADGILKKEYKILFNVYVRPDFHKHGSIELVNRLKESGLFTVCIGFESACEDELVLFNKKITLEDNEKTYEIFHKANIYIIMGYIAANPYSTFNSLRKNIEFLQKINKAAIDSIFSSLWLYKGTKIYEIVKNDNLLLDGKIDDRSGYNYKDKRIDNVMNYISNYISSLNQYNHLIFEFMNINDITFLYVFRMEFNDPQTEEYKYFQEYFREYDKIYNSISLDLCSWYYALLDLAELNFDIMAAEQLSEKYVSINVLARYSKLLKNEKSKLIKKLVMIDENNINSFVNNAFSGAI